MFENARFSDPLSQGKNMKTLLTLLAVATFVAVPTGCNNQPNVRYKHITGNLTPEMKGLSERPTDDHSAFAMASTQNLRMMWDDIGRSLYLDTPSRLSPIPTINTSGQPR
jgi:hypothetical protein